MASGGGAGSNSGDYVQMFIDYALRNNQDPVAAVDSMTIVHIKGEIGEFQGIAPSQYKTKVAFKQAIADRLAGNYSGAINVQKAGAIKAVESGVSGGEVVPGLLTEATVVEVLREQEELAPPVDADAVEIIDSIAAATVPREIEALPRVTVIEGSVLDAAPELSDTNAVELQIVGEVSRAPIPADATRVTAEITAGAPAKPTDIDDPTYRQRLVAWAQAMKGWLINYIKGAPNNTMLKVIRANQNVEYDQTFIYKHPLLQNIMSILPSDHEVYKRAHEAFEAGQAAQLALYDMLVAYVDLETMYGDIGRNYKAGRNTTSKLSGIKGVECALLFKYIMYVYLLRIKQEKRRMFEYIYFVRLTKKQRTTISTVKLNIMKRLRGAPAELNIASQQYETAPAFGIIPSLFERGMTAITSRELIGINAIVNEILNDGDVSCSDPSKPASTVSIKNRIRAVFTPIREGGVPTIQDGKRLDASILFTELDGLKIRDLPIIDVKKEDRPLLERIAYTTTTVTLGGIGLPSYAVSYAVKSGREILSTARGQLAAGAGAALQQPVVAAGVNTLKTIKEGAAQVPGIAQAGLRGLGRAANIVGPPITSAAKAAWPPVKEAAKIAWPHVRDATFTLPAVAGAVVGFPYLGHMTRSSPGTGGAGRSGGGATSRTNANATVGVKRKRNVMEAPAATASIGTPTPMPLSNDSSNTPNMKERAPKRTKAAANGEDEAMPGASIGVTGGGAGGMNDDTLPPRQGGGYRKTRRTKHKKTRKARLNRKVRKTRSQHKRLTRRR